MNLKRITQSLLFWIIMAILLGIVCSLFFPEWLAKVFVTFNGLFSSFLGFFVPVLIFALITPAISALGKGAGKWLGVTTGIAYASTVISGLIAYGVSMALYPTLLGDQGVGDAVDIGAGELEPYFSIEMPAPFEIMTALLLAFAVGLSMAYVKSETLQKAAVEFRDVIMLVVAKFVIPLLPFFIFGMFLSMGMNGNLVETLSMFVKVLLLATVMTFLVLVLQFSAAGIYAGKNPFTALKGMMPAYFTALGTSSSAATIPVTLSCVESNGVSKSVAGFVVPLSAAVHLSGSMMKISLFAFSIAYMDDIPVTVGQALGFVFMLGVMMVAAPGVPGGAIMAAVGVLQAQLGFDESQIALMIAAYIAIDSFGTACNVTGDGAIAMTVNKMAKGDLGGEEDGKFRLKEHEGSSLDDAQISAQEQSDNR